MCSGLDPPILATPEPVPQSLARPSPHPVTHYSASQKVQALDIKPSVWVSIESRRCWGISVARMASKPDKTRDLPGNWPFSWRAWSSCCSETAAYRARSSSTDWGSGLGTPEN